MEFMNFFWEILINFTIIICGGTILITFVAANYYKKTTSEMAFVRTGAGGNVVVCDGGALVLPLFQEVTWVKLGVQKVDVSVDHKDCFITKDRIRIDMNCSFYLKVEAEIGQILAAARTIGVKFFDRNQFSELLGPKLKSSIKNIINTTDFEEITCNSAEFEEKLNDTLNGFMTMNGLTLESVDLLKVVPTPVNKLSASSPFEMKVINNMTRQIETLKLEKKKMECESQIAIFKEGQKTSEIVLENNPLFKKRVV